MNALTLEGYYRTYSTAHTVVWAEGYDMYNVVSGYLTQNSNATRVLAIPSIPEHTQVLEHLLLP